MKPKSKTFFIEPVLGQGIHNAMTGRQLADLFDCDIRIITLQIESERRAGAKICATSGNPAGYFIAANSEELENYCGRLEHRAREMNATARALRRTRKKSLRKSGGEVTASGHSIGGEQLNRC